MGGSKSGGDEEALLSQEQYDQLQREFQDVMDELAGDKSLDHFRIEYVKLHKAMKRSHESELRLIKKCRELNQEIVKNAVKVYGMDEICLSSGEMFI